MNNPSDYQYDFTSDEVKKLVLFFRKYEEDLPSSLEDFFSSLEASIYNYMTIEEAEIFFNENKNT